MSFYPNLGAWKNATWQTEKWLKNEYQHAIKQTYLYMVHKKRCNIKICTFFTPAIKPLLYYYTITYTTSSVYFILISKLKSTFLYFSICWQWKKDGNSFCHNIYTSFIFVQIYIFCTLCCWKTRLGWHYNFIKSYYILSTKARSNIYLF